MEECDERSQVGQNAGTYFSPALQSFDLQLIGMVKKNSMDMHRITHLSYTRGASINSLIDPDDCITNYQTLDMALKLVAKHGPGCFMAKEDLNWLFRMSQCVSVICHSWELKCKDNFP